MLSRNFQARVSFVSPALKLSLLQPASRLVILKFGRARELPPHPKSLPQPRHAKSPFYPSAGNAGSTSHGQNRWGYAGNLPYISDKRVPKLGSSLPLRPPIRTLRPPKPAKPHAPPSASRPPPSRRLFPDYVIHCNSSPSLIYRTG